MSATTPPARREPLHHTLRRHATRPHGFLIIGGLIFVAAWLSWNFWLAAIIAPNHGL